MEEDSDKEEEETPDEEEIVWKAQLKSLDLYSMAGITTKNPSCYGGVLWNQRVLVLTDSGASHNFISQKMVKKYRQAMEMTVPYWVKVGNGERIQCNGVCKGVNFKLQGVKFIADFYVFCLDGEDVILGMEWLESLGDIKANIKDLKLSVKRDGMKYLIEGNPTLSKGEMTARQIVAELEATKVAYMVDCRKLQGEDNKEGEIPEAVTMVLQEYDTVFQGLEGLPPERAHDHAITLKEGANIPNQRPYRYPHF